VRTTYRFTNLSKTFGASVTVEDGLVTDAGFPFTRTLEGSSETVLLEWLKHHDFVVEKRVEDGAYRILVFSK
jgi:hypothetical protein